MSRDRIPILQKEVLSHVAQRSGEYAWFVRGLRSSRFLLPPEKSRLLLSAYAAFRRIDDIVDGDFPLPAGYESRESYVLRRIAAAEAPSTDYEDPADELLADAMSRGLEVSSEVSDILHSMLFDACRIGKGTVFSREELEYHFHLLDIRGTIGGALKVFGEEPWKVERLQYLGRASRVYYNLRDFEEDIEAGLVNVPAEDISRLGINIDNLVADPAVAEWKREQATLGIQLLDEHNRQMKGLPFKMHGRAALHLLYRIPAARYFEPRRSFEVQGYFDKVLAEN